MLATFIMATPRRLSRPSDVVPNGSRIDGSRDGLLPM
jgi:hypothetical protein